MCVWLFHSAVSVTDGGGGEAESEMIRSDQFQQEGRQTVSPDN